MSTHASSGIAWIAAWTAAWLVTVIDHAMPWTLSWSTSSQDQRIGAHGDRPGRVGPAQVGDEFVDEPDDPARRPRRAFPHPGEQDLAGPRAGRHQRVIAEPFRVAVRGALFVFAVNLTDRRVQIHDQRPVAGAGASGPRPPERSAQHGVELADVTERERPQEAAHCGGGHHLERQHPLGCPGPQHVDVIDVGRPGEHRRDQRQHLATWPRRTRLDPRVDQRLETKTDHQRRRHHQPRIGHDPAVIKGRLQPVDPARRCRHRKCLPRCG